MDAFFWLAGVSITGFLFLAGWCWNLHEKYSAIASTATKVSEMHIALLGDLAHDGFIARLKRIEETCKRYHQVADHKI